MSENYKKVGLYNFYFWTQLQSAQRAVAVEGLLAPGRWAAASPQITFRSAALGRRLLSQPSSY